jgi:hypothetical protein
MDSDERFDWLVLLTLALIGVSLSLHARMIGMTADKLTEVQADVNWLKDNTVAHETEARP